MWIRHTAAIGAIRDHMTGTESGTESLQKPGNPVDGGRRNPYNTWDLGLVEISHTIEMSVLQVLQSL
jgi:hypothetical protein